MKVAQVTFGFDPPLGGGDIYAAHLERFFRDAGWEHRVFQFARSQNPEVVGVGSPLPGVRGAFWGMARRLSRMREALSAFDLIVAHYPIYALAVRRALGGRRRPRLVGFSHGVTWDDAPHSWRGGMKKRYAQRAFAAADAFVANDTCFLREMGVPIEPRTRRFECVVGHAWFIPNAVDAAPFAGAAPLAELARFAPVLVPRNLYANRGIHLAVDAFAHFAQRNAECFLVVVGRDGQPRYAQRVKNRVRALGLGDRVIFWGWAPPAAMPSIYAAARMTLIPSVAGEGTSLAALESMAAGVATIATNIGGLPDLPAHLCQPTVPSLAAAMSEVYADRLALGARQQRLVIEHYSLDRWRAAWGEVVAQVMG